MYDVTDRPTHDTGKEPPKAGATLGWGQDKGGQFLNTGDGRVNALELERFWTETWQRGHIDWASVSGELEGRRSAPVAPRHEDGALFARRREKVSYSHDQIFQDCFSKTTREQR